MKSIKIQGSSKLPIVFDIHIAKAENSPLVIFLHGFKGFKDWGQWPLLAKEMAVNGVSVLRMNFSHNGTTPETPVDFTDLDAFSKNTFTKEVQDVEDVLNWITRNKNILPTVNCDDLHLMAHSRGGAIALIVTNEDERIKSVVTLSGVGSLDRFSEEELAYWEKTGTIHVLNGRTNQQLPLNYTLAQDFLLNRDRFEPQKVIQKITKPCLIIHAQNDETVLLSEAETLHNLALNSELKVIENANHSFGGAHPFTDNTLPLDTQKAMNMALDFIKS